MRVGIVVVKDTEGEFITVHASGAVQESRQIFNALKAECRMHRANGKPEECTIGGKSVAVLGVWLFTSHDGKYISQGGYETEAELKAKAQAIALKEKAIQKAVAEKEEAKEAQAKKAQADAEKKAKDEAKAKADLVKKQIEQDAVALKAQKAPKQKPAKQASKGK